MEPEPEVRRKKDYNLCITDNPDEEKYDYCSKKHYLVPDCNISLSLKGLTHQEAIEIELEIRNLLDRNDFPKR